MTLCEFLDEVRCGNVGRLCIAVCGEEEYLDNFKEGMYWELESGNWHEGSSSPTTPEIPEEFMDAEVTQIECESDLVGIFFNLGKLHTTTGITPLSWLRSLWALTPKSIGLRTTFANLFLMWNGLMQSIANSGTTSRSWSQTG